MPPHGFRYLCAASFHVLHCALPEIGMPNSSGATPAATPTRRAGRHRLFRSPYAILLLLLTLCVVKGLLGPGPIRVYTHDSWMFLDGAWRILNGQRPHHDFYSNLGFLCYLPTALGLQIARGAAAVNWGQCFSGMLVALLGVPLIFRRIRPSFASLYCTALVLLSIAPFALGEFFTLGTQGMFYNRWGYALLGILLVECVSPVGGKRPGFSDFGGGSIAGAVLALLFFVKFTFSVWALILICATIPWRRQTRVRWLGLALGSLIIGVAGLAFLRFDVAAILRDIHTVAVARRVSLLFIVGKPLQNLHGLTYICAFSAVAALGLSASGATGYARRWIWISLTVLGIDALALATNMLAQPAGFPFMCLATILMVADIAALVQPTEPFRSARQALLAWGLSIVLVNPVLDAAGLVYATRRSLQPRAFAGETIASPTADDLITTEYLNASTGANSLVEEANDGLRLLEASSTSTEKVAAFWFANPFSYWLQRPPMRHGSTNYDYGANFNEKSGPSPEYAFGDADVILVPRVDEAGLGWASQNPMERVYGPFLGSHFTKARESRFWWLYRKVP